jgi:hypothetical protein
MEGFLKDITNWWWWISVVALSFLLNLLAAYAKPKIDKMLSRIGATKRKGTDSVYRYIKYYGRSEIGILEIKQDIHFYFILVFLLLAISLAAFGIGIQHFYQNDQFSRFLFILFSALSVFALISALIFTRKCDDLIKVRAFIANKEKTKQ